jgi:pilus assembly protein Flp/PilA
MPNQDDFSSRGCPMLNLHEQQGQGLVEYALLLILIAILLLVVLTVFGGQVGNMFSKISNAMATLP